MAISAIQKLASGISKSPTLSLASRAAISRSSASVSAANSSSSAKVADRIVKLFAIDPDGQKHEVLGLIGQTLLKALTYKGLIDPASHRLEEIDACSSECEVHIAQEWLKKIPPQTHDEKYILTKFSRNRELNKHARLGCQVILTPDLQGMVVAIPEAKPWDTP
ncbi:hypothetical protein M569_08174 [Genlisea aurea]|uniref:2Fe-2S ferredoxin-type domain-containing protein n=1 Tax=Genlisea aurea TaxID=192259 RepID=S8DTV8_9LAMI|nr:hypothetical protein M569_08174 [Genlisea aurea]